MVSFVVVTLSFSYGTLAGHAVDDLAVFPEALLVLPLYGISSNTPVLFLLGSPSATGRQPRLGFSQPLFPKRETPKVKGEIAQRQRGAPERCYPNTYNFEFHDESWKSLVVSGSAHDGKMQENS
ncbi:hypothetical protein F5Y17DRAFT_9781 [Xylariaceae sp. FL0594]|nr:hypothetical protein F5Y17DRAFT_9781 [Xylariaceae sp. FL0594]